MWITAQYNLFTLTSVKCQKIMKRLVCILWVQVCRVLMCYKTTHYAAKIEVEAETGRLTGTTMEKEMWIETWPFIWDSKNLCSSLPVCVGVVCLQPWLHRRVHHQLQRAVSGAEPVQCVWGEPWHGGGLLFLTAFVLWRPFNFNIGDFDIFTYWPSKTLQPLQRLWGEVIKY